MKSLIVIYSYHHSNTLKIAKEMATVLNADVKFPNQLEINELNKYDLIGFGSGIDSDMHYKELLEFAEKIKENNNKNSFIFSTSTLQGDLKVKKDHSKLKSILEKKGFNILGEFSCKGYNTNSFLKYFGGVNKKHPNEEDINNAKQFAKKLINK